MGKHYNPYPGPDYRGDFDCGQCGGQCDTCREAEKAWLQRHKPVWRPTLPLVLLAGLSSIICYGLVIYVLIALALWAVTL